MRVMWMSNSPFLSTGYGVNTAEITKRLRRLGYDIVIAGFAGHMRGTTLLYEGMYVLPIRYHPFMQDVIEKYFKKFRCDILIAHFDIWVTPWLPEKLPTIAYSPIDIIFKGRLAITLKRILEKCKLVVPFTKEVEEICRKDLDNVAEYIPHGIDTSVFRPMDKEEIRKEMGIGKDDFVIGIVAANVDKTDRKNFYGMLETIRKFIDEVKDDNIKFYIHSDVSDTVRGIYLAELIEQFGLKDRLYMTDTIYFDVGLPKKDLAKIYNCFDVLLNLCKRGGFERIPLECMACGVVPLMTDWYNLREYLPEELRVRVKAVIGNALGGEEAIADTDHAVELLKKLYYDTSFYNKMRKKCIEIAKKYDWDNIIPKWDKLLGELE